MKNIVHMGSQEYQIPLCTVNPKLILESHLKSVVESADLWIYNVF